MARTLTSLFQAEIEAAFLQPALFVKAEFDGGDVLIWSGLGDKVFAGETYTGAGNLLGISRVKETQKMEANGVQFSLSGIPSSLVSLALDPTEYVWRPITLWFGVINDSAGELATWGDGTQATWGDGTDAQWADSPDDLVDDPYKLFSGKMDIMEIFDDGNTSTITVFAENELIALKVNKERRYTPEDQKRVYAGDLGLDFVPLIEDIELTWGVGV